MGQVLKQVNPVEVAISLVIKLQERAQETEDIRRIPEETIRELKEGGLFTMLRPKKYGGQELNLRTYSEAVVEISKGCASTGWIVALCAIRELMVAESFTEKAHDEIFGENPEDVLFAGVYEPRKCVVKKSRGRLFNRRRLLDVLFRFLTCNLGLFWFPNL